MPELLNEKDRLHVAFVTPEMGPYVKTGGLADISAALPKALVRLGHRVTVVLPRFGGIAFPPGEFAGSVHVPVDGNPRSAGFYRRRTAANVDVVFVEYPPFYDRGAIYGDYEDNRLRFAFLARAAVEYFRSRGERPSVFHAHDWQTGLVPVYLKAFYGEDPTLHRMPSVFTLKPEAYDEWLDPKNKEPDRIEAVLKKNYVKELRRYPVSKRVNNVENNSQVCMEQLNDAKK